jgi:hypothetical protein
MELTEFEKKILHLYLGDECYDPNGNQFIKDLRKIMPPICSLTERKFLDTFKEEFKPRSILDGETDMDWSQLWDENDSYINDDGGVYNLKDLMEGK